MSDTSLTDTILTETETETESVRAALRAFVQQRLPNGAVADDQDIFATGLVNSLFAMELVLFLEKLTLARIPNTHLSMNNFRSIEAMTRLALRLTSPPTGEAPS